MPVYLLDDRLAFPPPSHAEKGVLAVGGDMRPERLLLAYRMGIFPWYEEGAPILWHSPNPRCVLVLDKVHVSRSLRRVLRQAVYEVRYDTAFTRVIRACKEAERPGQDGTWITDEQEAAFVRLHELGFAHSVESWADGELQGGLYGVGLGRMFFGESMFSRRNDASKVALVTLAERLKQWERRTGRARSSSSASRRSSRRRFCRASGLRVRRSSVAYLQASGVIRGTNFDSRGAFRELALPRWAVNASMSLGPVTRWVPSLRIAKPSPPIARNELTVTR